MYFYVDESGHTGTHLFDENQPILAYGVLSSRCNLDVLAADALARLRADFKVNRLHANELKVEGLDRIAPLVFSFQKKLDLRFDLYRVFKADYALISFFIRCLIKV